MTRRIHARMKSQRPPSKQAMPGSKPPRPISLGKAGEDRLRISWSDGRTGTIGWNTLREVCPCAACEQKRQQPVNPLRVLSDKELRSGPLRPKAVTPVGQYAYKIVWSDGHDAGLFTFEFLYSLCQWPPNEPAGE
jgi:DUF971 family protein